MTTSVCLLELVKTKNSQKYILAQIFNKNKGIWLPKREVEKQLVLLWSFRNITDNDIKTYSNKDELISHVAYVPGDIQRDLRLFYDMFRKYGLEKKEKSTTDILSYRWNPINKNELDNIVHPAARNIFKTEIQLSDFLKKKDNKCEMCEKSSTDNNTLRMAVDHWRAHSVYNIDSEDIAVLLCEQCNNVHHNYDGSKIALKNKDNTKIIKNWVMKEKEIRSKGFYPNKSDLQQQKDIIEQISEYHITINKLTSDFWEGLIQ